MSVCFLPLRVLCHLLTLSSTSYSCSTEIHHINCLEPGLLLVGYLNVGSSFDPSLALVRLNTAQSASPLVLLKDLQDSVCVNEEMDAPHHRYNSQFLPEW